jgi:AraC family transcriptional regulator
VLTTHTAHHSPTVQVHLVRCRPHDGACGPEEHAATNLLVFPLRGVFVKHHGSRERVVADPWHALFFCAGEPYRVSHPVDGGDECLVLEPSPEMLADIHAAKRRYVPLDASLIAQRRWLWHRLQRRIASALETEETALRLFAGTLRAPSPREPNPETRSRCKEIVEAIQITLAARPADPWTLGALAQRVHSSPFRVAHAFREFAGMPLHRYHLLARMAAALDEVLDSSRDFTTIGIALGFSSHSHFTVTFRRTFGITPSELRRRASSRQISKILTAQGLSRP